MTDPDFEIPEFSYSKRRRKPAFDPMMRQIALAAGGVATLVIVVALVWGGMKPGIGFGPPPVIQAPPGPLRVAPDNPGGLVVPGADQQIMSGQSGAVPDALTPATPAPDISAFQPPPPASSPAAAPLVPPPKPVPPVIDSKIQVQLAAVVDPAGARTAWARLNSKMPALLSGRTPLYSHGFVAGVEFWRLRLGGFTDIGAARQFCAAVKAQGEACTVAAF